MQILDSLAAAPPALPPAAYRALMKRHSAAMRIIERLPSAEDRLSLLAAVVCPQDERLLGDLDREEP